MEIKKKREIERVVFALGGMGLERRGGGGRGGGRAEIERVVSPLTVTESEPLSCCQEKNTEAHINRTLTLFPFALYSPLALLLLLLALSLSSADRAVHVSLASTCRREFLSVNVDLGPSLRCVYRRIVDKTVKSGVR